MHGGIKMAISSKLILVTVMEELYHYHYDAEQCSVAVMSLVHCCKLGLPPRIKTAIRIILNRYLPEYMHVKISVIHSRNGIVIKYSNLSDAKRFVEIIMKLSVCSEFLLAFISIHADINECTSGISGCSQTCDNTIGGYTCGCYPGYDLSVDSKSCIGKNEYYYRIHSEVYIMKLDMLISYLIIYCVHGIHSSIEFYLAVINQCAKNAGRGDCDQICTPTNGSFYCSCLSGYSLNGYSCNGRLQSNYTLKKLLYTSTII